MPDTLTSTACSSVSKLAVWNILNINILIGMVDVIFADVAQPDQARIVSINAQHFLKNQGHFVISIKVSKAVLSTDSLLDKAILFSHILLFVCCDSVVRAGGIEMWHSSLPLLVITNLWLMQ